MFTGHFPFMASEQLDPELVTLTVLREPIARTISILKQFKRREERFRDLPLEAVYDDRPIFRFFVENHQTKVFALAPEDNEVAINCGMDDRRRALRVRARTSNGSTWSASPRPTTNSSTRCGAGSAGGRAAST